MDFGGWKLPPYTPSMWWLPWCWTAAYIALSLAAYSVAVAGINDNSVCALRLYIWQIVCTLPLPLFFFRLDWQPAACVWAALTTLHATGLLSVFRRVRPIAYLIGLCYLLWIAFSVYWYLGLYLLNPPA